MINKHITSLLFIIFFCNIQINAQTLTDVANSTELTWYGIDFSETRFVNFSQYTTANMIKGSLSSWSLNPLTSDYKKFIRNKYDKQDLIIDLSSSERRNDATDFNDRLVSESYDLDAERINTIVSDYDIKGEGYGLLLIAEGFDNKSGNAYIWVTFINKPNKKIISTKRYVCDVSSNWKKAIDQALKLSSSFLRHLN